MNNLIKKIDPIRDSYNSIELSDKIYGIIFYITAIISITLFFIDKNKYEFTYNIIQIIFLISAVILFILGTIIRLYLTPRCENKRLKDFLSNSYGLDLSHEKTFGYYNNNFSEPLKRIAAQILENSLFSKSIILKMAVNERIKSSVYICLFIIAILFRNTNLEFISIISQFLFSEELLSRLIRVEWMRMRFEKIYDNIYNLFISDPTKNKFDAMTFH